MSNRSCVSVVAATFLLASTACATDVAESLSREAGYTLHCEMHCSETKLRTGVATITWVAPQGRAGASALSAGGAEAPRIDVTVFSDGFAQGNFVTFDRFGVNAQPRALAAPGTNEDRRDLRAFDLRVDSTSTGREAAATLPRGFAAPADSEAVSIEVENVEPGVLYTFRLRPPASDEEVVVNCEAPICPADMREEDQP